ncbi:RING/U-box superfamily protein [Rhynchospora pubera]|uniref:RING-type E3 ubiquitin transferase n=1 Tax=Rhynchospora pubera TaxID=906938 RepID=A0AAV8DCY0_9POAL|nr:RING/U-box superfamily protein [Rhynchospora pubera]
MPCDILIVIILIQYFVFLLYYWFVNRNAPTDDDLSSNMNFVHRSNESHRTISGLHPSVIAALPVLVYQKGRKDADGDGSAQCVVCLEQLEEGEKVRVLLRCKHLFHVNCINMWLRLHSTCPICRADAKPPDSLAVVMVGLSNMKVMESTTAGPGASLFQ